MQTTASNNLRLAISPDTPWHHKWDFQGNATEGGASRRTKELPRLDGWWKRYRSGHLWVREVVASAPGATLILTCDLSHRLVHIPVRYGHPVCVDFHHVIAMTSNMRVRSSMQLSLPALCTRRAFVTYMECITPASEGSLVLQIAGEACTLSQEAEFDMSRVVAWHPEVRFRMTHLPRIADVFLTQPFVRIADAPAATVNVLLKPGSSGTEKTIATRLLELLRIIFPV